MTPELENTRDQIGFCGIWCGSCMVGNGALRELTRRYEAITKAYGLPDWAAKDFDHALQIANSTRHALTGGLYSRSPVHIDRARRDFAVGNLYINRRITGSQVDAQPFGGFRLSGTGVKAGSPDYLLHFMDARCLTENTLRSGLVPAEEHTEPS